MRAGLDGSLLFAAGSDDTNVACTAAGRGVANTGNASRTREASRMCAGIY